MRGASLHYLAAPQGAGFLFKTKIMMRYLLMGAVRSGGDGKYSKTIVCPEGCVMFRLTVKSLGTENFHTGDSGRNLKQ